jgi:DNA-binding transcriptional LysR family regulator
MTFMHVDLNLLAALDALLDEGTVSGAARRLHVTQPAMSRTLARIREATGDPILVRAGRAMVPSARAREVRAEVRRLVRQGQALLAPQRAFDPARLARTFTLQMHDALVAHVGAALVARVRREAPQVALRFLAEGAGDADDLRPGRVDLDVGSPKPRSPALREEALGHDVLVVALRAARARKKLTAPRFAALRHVIVSRRGRLRDPVDDQLEALGLRRTVVAAAPTSAAALQLARACDLAVVVAARACAPTAKALGLVVRPLPFSCAPVPLVQSWHAHLDDDAGHAWLRGLTRAIVEATLREATKA